MWCKKIMTNASNNSVQFLSATSRPNEFKANREANPSAGIDFAAQFKNEVNKAQAKPAEKAPAAKPAEPESNSRELANKPTSAEPAKPVPSEPNRSAELSESELAERDAANQAAAPLDAQLAALLAQQLAQTPAVKVDPASQTSQDELGQGKSLIVAIGDQAKSALLGAQLESDADDLLAQDQNKGRGQQPFGGSQLLAASDSAAKIAVDELNMVADLPLDVKNLSSKIDATSFADTLSARLNSNPTLPTAGVQLSNSISTPLTAATAASAALPSQYIDTPVQDARWGEVVAQRVSMMLGKEQQIEMQLNPPNLGPMEVRLNLGDEQASVIFTSQHAAVREALAAATPKLTALLADQGIVLQNVQVASDSLQQQQQNAFQQQQGNRYNHSQPVAPMGNEVFAQGVGSAAERILTLNDLRVPVGSTRVSLFV